MAFGLSRQAPVVKTTRNVSSTIDEESIYLRCRIDRFVFKNEDNGYFVFRGTTIERGNLLGGHSVVCKGAFPSFLRSAGVGQEVDVWGKFEINPRFGEKQLALSFIQEVMPESIKAMEAFVGSGKLPGIGPATAKKIVAKFGLQTLQILDESPQKLMEVKGVNEKKIPAIKEAWQEWRAVYDIVSKMKVYGVGDAVALKIFDRFGRDYVRIIAETPYSLTEVEGVGFKTADLIAQSNGVSRLDNVRIEQCVLFVLNESITNGSTVQEKSVLVERATELLDIPSSYVMDRVAEMVDEGSIISKKIVAVREGREVEVDGIADIKVYRTEERIAKEIQRISSYQSSLVGDLAKFIKVNPNGLDESQLEAAKNLLSGKVGVLTGGPGTGKTHTIKSLINYFDSCYYKGDGGKEYTPKIVMCAPTGRAAKRMEESTGRSSSTIHRLLGYNVDGSFAHDSINKLVGDVFIIDESSMVDIWIANALLKAIPSDAVVIFVGDSDQLPSVGPGNVLKDIMESGVVNVSRLSVVHRQALGSDIIVSSHDVIHQKMPKLNSFDSDSDFVFIEEPENADILERIKFIVQTLRHQGVPEKDIQVLTPRRETLLGVEELNACLKQLLNPYSGAEVDFGIKKFAPMDRVMQLKNEKNLEIFNGDVGRVTNVYPEMYEFTVQFDGGPKLDMRRGEAKNLSLAYAVTIHKSQGSDYPYVIIPISKSHTFMWDANLLYTAITRGKKRVILIGDKRTLKLSVSKFKQNVRSTTLKEHLVNAFPKVEAEPPQTTTMKQKSFGF